MIVFGILAFIFSNVSYQIPGFPLSTDLREIFAIISIAYLSHWIYAAGVGLITALAGPYGDMFTLNIIGHILFIPAYWLLYRIENRKIQNNWLFGAMWVLTVFVMYAVLFVLVLAGDIIKGESIAQTATKFLSLYHAFKMEALFTAVISALSLTLIRVDQKVKFSLERLVQQRTEQLEEATMELVQKEKLSVLGQITASVSHDLRNPLATIRGTLFSVRDALEKQQAERANRALELADRNVVRCDNILEDLLNFTKKRDMLFEQVDLGEWLGRLIDEQVAFENVIFIREFGPGPEIRIDQEQLRRAVINVITNAVQSYDDDDVNKKISVGVSKSDDRVNITVSDEGKGIDEESLERIFEPLFSTKAYGVGLGLPIVKDILDEHGGGIFIDSEKGRGTSVTLWIPFQKE